MYKIDNIAKNFPQFKAQKILCLDEIFQHFKKVVINIFVNYMYSKLLY